MTPWTSVQISMQSAERAAPTIEAEKSEPPRPSVEVIPPALEAMKPPITGTELRAMSGSNFAGMRSLVAAKSGAARVKAESVIRHSRESTSSEAIPSALKAAVTSVLEQISP